MVRAESRIAFPADVVGALFNRVACDEIGFSPQGAGEVPLHLGKIRERVPSTNVEPHKHINIAVWTEVVAQHGTEQGDFRNSPSHTECRETLVRNRDVIGHGGTVPAHNRRIVRLFATEWKPNRSYLSESLCFPPGARGSKGAGNPSGAKVGGFAGLAGLFEETAWLG